MGAQQSRQLLEAASTGDVQKASQLLMSVPVDSTDDDAWTALHFSSWAGRALVVKELLNHSANARARDKVSSSELFKHTINPSEWYKRVSELIVTQRRPVALRLRTARCGDQPG